MKRRLSFPLLALFLIYLSGCSVNPVTGKNELLIVSPQQEVAIGTENYLPSQQAQGGRYYIDPDLQVYVAEVGRKLAAQSDRPELPYEFVVLNSSIPNAWALPGGKIALNRGLLAHLEDEAELAAVLGHEIVHAAARHSAQQMTRGTFIGAGVQLLGIGLQNEGYGELAGTALQIGSAAWMARYGRSAELEADAYGMEYMAKAGYEPHGAVKLQQTFVRLSEGRQSDFFSNLFASHPPSQERVEANREKAMTLPHGETYRDRYQQKIAQLKKDAPAYEAETEAMKALQAKNAQLALQHLDQAVKLQPNEGNFWELRGHAWAMQEEFEKADQAFTTAIQKNPEYFRHYLARGVLRYQRNRFDAARNDLQKSNQILETQQANFLLGEISYRGDNQQLALEYYRNASSGGGEIGNRASQKVMSIELPMAPEKYIASGVAVNDQGYLSVGIRNTSAINVRGIQVQLVNKATGTAVVLNSDETLAAGGIVWISTSIGPISETNPLANYGTRVLRANPG